jgi:hypothetical protein
MGRRAADNRQSSQQRESQVTHENFPSAEAVIASIPLRQPKPGGAVPVNSHLMRLEAARFESRIGKDFICRAEKTRPP